MGYRMLRGAKKLLKQKIQVFQSIFNNRSLQSVQTKRLQLYIEQCFHIIRQINTMGNLGLFDFLEGELQLIVPESDPLYPFLIQFIKCHTERTSYEALVYSIEMLEAELPYAVVQNSENRKVIVTLKYVTRFIYEADEIALYNTLEQMINLENTSAGIQESIDFKTHLIRTLQMKKMTELYPQLEDESEILGNKIMNFTDYEIQNLLRASFDKSISAVLAICSEEVEAKILSNASPLMGLYLKEAALDLVFNKTDLVTLKSLLKQVMERM